MLDDCFASNNSSARLAWDIFPLRGEGRKTGQTLRWRRSRVRVAIEIMGCFGAGAFLGQIASYERSGYPDPQDVAARTSRERKQAILLPFEGAKALQNFWCCDQSDEKAAAPQNSFVFFVPHRGQRFAYTRIWRGIRCRDTCRTDCFRMRERTSWSRQTRRSSWRFVPSPAST